MQKHADPKHTCTPAAASRGNQRDQPIDLDAACRIQAAEIRGNEGDRPIDRIAAGVQAAGSSTGIENRPAGLP